MNSAAEECSEKYAKLSGQKNYGLRDNLQFVSYVCGRYGQQLDTTCWARGFY